MSTSQTKLFVIASLAVLTSGCEVQTLYEVQLSDLDVNQGSAVIRQDNVSLHLAMSNSTDAPAITLIAAVDDLEPTWDWEEFQGWPEEEQRSLFGAYYDRKYPSFDVSFKSVCPLQVERFDNRESAQENAYGQWLHNIEPANHGYFVSPRGQLVSVPIDQCESALDELHAEAQRLVISMTDPRIGNAETIEIEFRVGKVGTWLKVWGRSFQLS